MLAKRSAEKELLDLGPAYYSEEEFQDCQKKLFRVNKLFGFFRSTVKLLKSFPPQSSLLDVGCGGGLFLLHLSRYFPKMQLQGVDISTAAIAQAESELRAWKEKYPDNNNLSFVLHQQNDFNYGEKKIDLILTTLMCHHLSDEELILFLKESLAQSKVAVIINDLHRHYLPAIFYRLFSPLLFRNRLITYDGLISIRRSFTRADWQQLLKKADIQDYQLRWCFPFRWQVILWKK